MATAGIEEVQARAISRYVGLTGAERADAIEYFKGVPTGRWGPVSAYGQRWALRILTAMGAA